MATSGLQAEWLVGVMLAPFLANNNPNCLPVYLASLL